MASEDSFPDDENGDVLRLMQEEGVDLSRPRTIEFEHVFPDENSARQFGESVDQLVGSSLLYPPEDEDPEEEIEDGEEWEVVCRVTMVPSHTNITGKERELAEIAVKFGGRADGWGSLSNPDESPME